MKDLYVEKGYENIKDDLFNKFVKEGLSQNEVEDFCKQRGYCCKFDAEGNTYVYTPFSDSDKWDRIVSR